MRRFAQDRSSARRSVYTELSGRSGLRHGRTPDLVRFGRCIGVPACQQESRVVVVIGRIVAMSVHGPIQVFLDPMRMAVVLHHFEVILDRLENCGCMCESRNRGPDDQCQAHQCCQDAFDAFPRSEHMSYLLEAAVFRPFLLNTVESTRQQVGFRERQSFAEK